MQIEVKFYDDGDFSLIVQQKSARDAASINELERRLRRSGHWVSASREKDGNIYITFWAGDAPIKPTLKDT